MPRAEAPQVRRAECAESPRPRLSSSPAPALPTLAHCWLRFSGPVLVQVPSRCPSQQEGVAEAEPWEGALRGRSPYMGRR